MGLIEELRWRGLIQDIIPGTDQFLSGTGKKGYVGFDPTGTSLHVGSLVPIILLKHFQNAGHIPYALVGGATGMIGDPSGKSQERNLLSEEDLKRNEEAIQKQLERFIDFSDGKAQLVNNYTWFKDFRFLEFIRDVGKHITVNYMMAKDSVKNRLENGMSFTEFSYQLVQGYDFYHLNREYQVEVQFGGSDQWGNIVTGTELVRRKSQNEVYAFTAPLIRKADGTKFGKTESGNIWLDPDLTSPYKFYQFWLNTSDEDAESYIKIFTFLPKEEIESLIQQHYEDKGLRILQKKLAEELTVFVHSKEDLEIAQNASHILFGNNTAESLYSLNEKLLMEVLEGVPLHSIRMDELTEGIKLTDLLAQSGVMSSKSEARKMISAKAISINKVKREDPEFLVTKDLLIHSKFILVQKGKKNYYLLVAS